MARAIRVGDRVRRRINVDDARDITGDIAQPKKPVRWVVINASPFPVTVEGSDFSHVVVTVTGHGGVGGAYERTSTMAQAERDRLLGRINKGAK